VGDAAGKLAQGFHFLELTDLGLGGFPVGGLGHQPQGTVEAAPRRGGFRQGR
jgi:hypothetical protein